MWLLSVSVRGPRGSLRRRVIRVWPTIKGWRAETLKQREDAERVQYGIGRLEGRIDKEKFLQEEEVRRLEGLYRGGEKEERPTCIKLSE